MKFKTGAQLVELCHTNDITISQVMLYREIELSGRSERDIVEQMQHTLNVMKSATHSAIEKPLNTMGGLIGGEARLLATRSKPTACGSLMNKAISYAMSVLEVNASMGIIVAAPTAGSSGVLPGGLMAIAEEYDISDDRLVMALFNAAAIGYLITRNATVAGAEGGCQAEVGAASAMAASAVTELLGGSPKACIDAAATAIANILGLVCDPVGGLVEAPCQKRNAMGVSNALVCAEMSLSGITHLVPFDEMVEVMYSVGKVIPPSLRETALGGMAKAPSACAACGKCR